MMSPKSRVPDREVHQMDLIPGMPHDVAVDCLARVPHGAFRSMRRVCRGWKSTAAAPEFALARAEAGANEDLVYLLQFRNPAVGDDGPKVGEAPAYGVAMYNVTTGEWHRERAAPPMPMFAQCAAVGTRLAVMGGWDPETFEPVADVHVLDAATGVWRQGTPMRSARSFFACAEAGGKIYVAGGHDKLKNALKTAEAYDVVADGWDPLPDMSEERDECDGMATVAGDKFLAVSGYRTGRQGGFEHTRNNTQRTHTTPHTAPPRTCNDDLCPTRDRSDGQRQPSGKRFRIGAVSSLPPQSSDFLHGSAAAH